MMRKPRRRITCYRVSAWHTEAMADRRPYSWRINIFLSTSESRPDQGHIVGSLDRVQSRQVVAAVEALDRLLSQDGILLFGPTSSAISMDISNGTYSGSFRYTDSRASISLNNPCSVFERM